MKVIPLENQYANTLRLPLHVDNIFNARYFSDAETDSDANNCYCLNDVYTRLGEPRAVFGSISIYFQSRRKKGAVPIFRGGPFVLGGSGKTAISALSRGLRFLRLSPLKDPFDSALTKAISPMLTVNPFIWLILELIELYTYVVVAAVIVSWLIAFGVLNTYNSLARSIVTFLDAATEPVFRQVRKVIPPIGGLDISPLIVLIALQFLSYLISYYG